MSEGQVTEVRPQRSGHRETRSQRSGRQGQVRSQRSGRREHDAVLPVDSIWWFLGRLHPGLVPVRLGTPSQRRSNQLPRRAVASPHWVCLGAAVASPQEQLEQPKCSPVETQWGDATARRDNMTQQRIAVQCVHTLTRVAPTEPKPLVLLVLQ